MGYVHQAISESTRNTFRAFVRNDSQISDRSVQAMLLSKISILYVKLSSHLRYVGIQVSLGITSICSTSEMKNITI
jgi:hypothetical protein